MRRAMADRHTSWQIENHPGRLQSWTVWHHGEVWCFTSTLEAAKSYIERHKGYA